MCYSNRRSVRLFLAMAFGFFLAGAMAPARLARADETGTLKLRVSACIGGGWISGAAVQAVLYRPGVGVIDSASGTTNFTGYVEFTFTGLEADDEAHVTVTPSGQKSDANHTYYWVENRQKGAWDLSASGGDSLCEDSWYDLVNRIIHCVYNGS